MGMLDKVRAVKEMPGQAKLTTVIAVAGIVIAIVALIASIGVASGMLRNAH